MIALFGALIVAVAAPETAAGPLTNQALFDKATADYDARRCTDAAAGFATLASRLQPKSRSLPIVRAREGAAFVCAGHTEEGAALLRSALGDLAGREDAASQRAEASLALGQAEEAQLDYAGALRDFRIALAADPTAGPMFRVSALTGIARVTMFDDSAAALQSADQAMALVTGQAETAPNAKRFEAELHTLRGRILLNRGEIKPAQSELNLAVKQLGGLTMKVDIADLSARGDLAIAASLAHDDETAHKLLAFTGAGHLKAALPKMADKVLPPCGSADVGPADVVVVQFGIDPDGSVRAVLPIYASRPGPLALTFARAVAGWSWTTDEVAKIDPFFLAQTRLELRCTNSAERPELSALLRDQVEQWFRERKVDAFDPPAGSAAQLAALAKAELTRRETAFGKDQPALLPPLMQLAENLAVPRDERLAIAERAAAIAAAADAAAAVRTIIATDVADLAAAKATSPRMRRSLKLKSISLALAVPNIQADARAADVLYLYEADVLDGSGDAGERIALLKRVGEDGRLPASDLIRVGAQIRLASLYANSRDLAAARAAYDRTGLTDQQCSLVDAEPAMKGNPGSSSDFPMEALMWGFEGWVVTEFDIDAKGSTKGLRAVVAYPPFVFDRAATSVFARARFTQSYRPQGGLGCRASNSTVTFRIPGH